MKNCKAIFLLTIFLSPIALVAQDVESSGKLYINLGLKYAIGEGQAGPILGISLDNDKSRFAFNFRGDLVFKIGRSQPNQNNYQLVHYTTYNYLDVDYKLKNSFRLTAGAGWIYGSVDNNTKLDTRTGYYVVTFAVKYEVQWLVLELRGDLPIMNESQKATLNKQAPFSLAFVFPFNPKQS